MACAALRAAVTPPGLVACTSDAQFGTSATIFNRNLQVERAPFAVVTPATIGDLAAVLRIARRFQLPLAVRNGGHNPAGWALSPGGITLDMSLQRAVHVEASPAARSDGQPATPYADVGGGALWSDVYGRLEFSGLYAVGGGCSGVGVAGLALNGGIAFTSRKRGLVGDGVLSFTLVLPNGTVVETSGAEEPATDPSLRALHLAMQAGGASTFGVVWALRLRLWPVPEGGHGHGRVHVSYRRPQPLLLQAAAAAYFGNLDATSDDEAWTIELMARPDGLLFMAFYDGPAADWVASGRGRGVFDRIANLSLHAAGEGGRLTVPGYNRQKRAADAKAGGRMRRQLGVQFATHTPPAGAEPTDPQPTDSPPTEQPAGSLPKGSIFGESVFGGSMLGKFNSEQSSLGASISGGPDSEETSLGEPSSGASVSGESDSGESISGASVSGESDSGESISGASISGASDSGDVLMFGWHRILLDSPEDAAQVPVESIVRSGDFMHPQGLLELARMGGVTQMSVWWRSAFVFASIGATGFGLMLEQTLRESPEPLLRKVLPRADCFLQIEQLGGAIDRTNASTWAHRGAVLIASWICMWDDAHRQPKQRSAGTPWYLPGVERRIERWMEDGIRSLGTHARGAYQGYASKHDKPEALFGPDGLLRLSALQADIDGARGLFGPGAGRGGGPAPPLLTKDKAPPEAVGDATGGRHPQHRAASVAAAAWARNSTAGLLPPQYILVTGGTSGIGLATAAALSSAVPGAQVLLGCRNQTLCANVSLGTRLACLPPVDLSIAPGAAAEKVVEALSAAVQFGGRGACLRSVVMNAATLPQWEKKRDRPLSRALRAGVLAHQALLNLLLPSREDAPTGSDLAEGSEAAGEAMGLTARSAPSRLWCADGASAVMVASGASRLATRSGVARLLAGKAYAQRAGAALDAPGRSEAARPLAEAPASLADYFGHGTDGEVYASTKLMQALVAREADRRSHRPPAPDRLDQRPPPVRVLAVAPTRTARTALSSDFVMWTQAAGVLQPSDVASAEEAAAPIVAAVRAPASAHSAWDRLLPEWARSECDAMAAWELATNLLKAHTKRSADAELEVPARASDGEAAAAVGCASPEDLRFWPHTAPSGRVPGAASAR